VARRERERERVRGSGAVHTEIVEDFGKAESEEEGLSSGWLAGEIPGRSAPDRAKLQIT
jgi:hypothetical protein